MRLLWLPGSWCWRRKVSLWVASRGLRLLYLYPPMPRRPSSVCPSDHHWPSSTLSGCFLEPLFADLKLVWNIIVSNLDSIWICCAFRTSAPAIFYICWIYFRISAIWNMSLHTSWNIEIPAAPSVRDHFMTEENGICISKLTLVLIFNVVDPAPLPKIHWISVGWISCSTCSGLNRAATRCISPVLWGWGEMRWLRRRTVYTHIEMHVAMCISTLYRTHY